MSEFPEDIKKDAEEAVAGFMGWIEGGNTTASLSEHAVAGLKHSFASAILAERRRCMKVAQEAMHDEDQTDEPGDDDWWCRSIANGQAMAIHGRILKGGAA